MVPCNVMIFRGTAPSELGVLLKVPLYTVGTLFSFD